MPLFVYKCVKCAKKIEALQSWGSDGKLYPVVSEKCTCGSSNFERVISKPSGFVFKGQGFYETDYKNKET